eukprot:6156158-Prymnesium_polylepis.2
MINTDEAVEEFMTTVASIRWDKRQTDAVVTRLRRLAFFREAGCAHSDLVAMLRSMQHTRLAPGEWLFRHGDKPEFYYVLVNGSIQVRAQAADHRRSTPTWLLDPALSPAHWSSVARLTAVQCPRAPLCVCTCSQLVDEQDEVLLVETYQAGESCDEVPFVTGKMRAHSARAGSEGAQVVLIDYDTFSRFLKEYVEQRAAGHANYDKYVKQHVDQIAELLQQAHRPTLPVPRRPVSGLILGGSTVRRA